MATPQLREAPPPPEPRAGRYGAPPAKRETLQLIERLLRHGIRDNTTLAVLLDITPRYARYLRSLLEPRPRSLAPAQALRMLAAEDPELLDKVHTFRCGVQQAHKLPGRGENVVPMIACSACIAAVMRSSDALKRANRSRWFSPDRRSVTSQSVPLTVADRRS